MIYISSSTAAAFVSAFYDSEQGHLRLMRRSHGSEKRIRISKGKRALNSRRSLFWKLSRAQFTLHFVYYNLQCLLLVCNSLLGVSVHNWSWVSEKWLPDVTYSGTARTIELKPQTQWDATTSTFRHPSVQSPPLSYIFHFLPLFYSSSLSLTLLGFTLAHYYRRTVSYERRH